MHLFSIFAKNAAFMWRQAGSDDEAVVHQSHISAGLIPHAHINISQLWPSVTAYT